MYLLLDLQIHPTTRVLVHAHLVSTHVLIVRERLPTDITHVRFLSCVDPHVLADGASHAERLITDRTFERLVRVVRFHVQLHGGGLPEGFTTNIAHVGLLTCNQTE